MIQSLEEKLFSDLEKATQRYIEAEEFIMNLKWYECIFSLRKIHNFIKSRKKYKF